MSIANVAKLLLLEGSPCYRGGSYAIITGQANNNYVCTIIGLLDKAQEEYLWDCYYYGGYWCDYYYNYECIDDPYCYYGYYDYYD